VLNIIIAGTGGQGTIFTARLIGETACAAGFDVRGSETIGMAQRGGSVVSHLRISLGADDTAWSPLVPRGEAGLVIGFELAEAVRVIPFLGEGGVVVVADIAVPPSGGSPYDSAAVLTALRKQSEHIVIADSAEITARFGPRCLNTALLGIALSRGIFPFDAVSVEETLRRRLSPALLQPNIYALHEGASLRIEN
jgi:indolepyruvate ferredoxin oxidoreductase beta subunit